MYEWATIRPKQSPRCRFCGVARAALNCIIGGRFVYLPLVPLVGDSTRNLTGLITTLASGL
jgi:hypothetical protein